MRLAGLISVCFVGPFCSAVQAAVKEAESTFGPLDVLVTCAGIATPGLNLKFPLPQRNFSTLHAHRTRSRHHRMGAGSSQTN